MARADCDRAQMRLFGLACAADQDLLTLPDAFDVFCLKSLRALNDLVFHELPFLQGLVAVAVNRDVVTEDVGSSIALEKAEAFCVVEPDDLSFVL
jgi:hypothetical protein